MAKVIFEFTWLESCEYQGGEVELLDVKARLADASPAEDTGPHDLLANIVLAMVPEIIKKAKDEMLTTMNKVGMEAEGNFVPHSVNVVKH
ncbi:hypothetical protein AB6N27_22945 [Escherichia coli]|uniref:hypothetical protein n=1 Tax=Escherichia coli TaxID=562 RepID=UPI001793F278|nr:hypothetical protein [Escherichia coli]EGZ6179350.1 hypothetical protein [Salmonella enterica subsp. enterica serovar Montevideo]EFD0879439.1 hypothetical protein [Escherichia coli]EHC5049109.1 hypothetical protein [Escherichia coli]EHJ5214741.1 hypothetical protein [Salmonella enterica subsp. enterica serovar Montevideo]